MILLLYAHVNRSNFNLSYRCRMTSRRAEKISTSKSLRDCGNHLKGTEKALSGIRLLRILTIACAISSVNDLTVRNGRLRNS
jgi:hypothetical protein